jgi:S1-C subfamily serine protease
MDEEVTVTRPDGRVDIPCLKVDVLYVAVAAVGESDAVRVGHIVLAVGPGPRASWGVVSAVGSGRGARSAAGELLNLDLTLYPGFSGGPLVDVQGRVVGVNTSGASRQLQLAIPAAAVNRLLDELGRRGRIPRAYLGVSTQQVRLPEGIRQRFSLDQQTAVIVVDVQPNSPAAGAGLLIGDIIVSLGGTSITPTAELQSVLRPDRVAIRSESLPNRLQLIHDFVNDGGGLLAAMMDLAGRWAPSPSHGRGGDRCIVWIRGAVATGLRRHKFARRATIMCGGAPDRWSLPRRPPRRA